MIPDIALPLGEGDHAGADLRLEFRLERVLDIRSGRSPVGERDRVRLGPQVARICWRATKFERNEMVFFVGGCPGVVVAVLDDLLDLECIREGLRRSDGRRPT